MSELHLIGAGGHARVVFDVIQGIEPKREVVWHDDAWQQIEPHAPVNRVYPTDLLKGAAAFDCFVAIGNAVDRLALIRELAESGNAIVTLEHPDSTVSPYAAAGRGSVFMAGSVVQTGAVLGTGVIVNTGASVDHDCQLGDGVHIAPGAHLAGNVVVGAASWIGIGAVVREGVEVGANVMVGAGAVVVGTVPDGSMVMGNPARETGK